MIIFKSRIAAEKRIRGLFMQKKTHMSVKGISFILAGVLGLSCFTTACQKTPDKAIVQSKKEGKMFKIIEESNKNPQQSPYDAPKEWEESFVSGNGELEVVMKAEIETNDISSYPVYTIKPCNITQEKADLIMKALLQGRTLYSTNYGTEVLTKDYIDLTIETYMEWLQNPEAGEESKEEIKEDIKRWQQRYDKAQKSRYEIPAQTAFGSVIMNQELRMLEREWLEEGTVGGRPGTEEDYNAKREGILEYIASGDSSEIEGIVELDGGKEGFFSIHKTNDNKNNFVEYSVYDLKQKIFDQIGVGNRGIQPANELKISEEEALEGAKKVISDMGIDYMNVGLINHESYEYPAHNFYFFRKIERAMPSFVPHDQSAFNPYRAEWKQEYLYIEINDDGLRRLFWRSPTELLEKKAESVKMLPFDEIKEIFKQQILVNAAYFDEGGNDDVIIGRRLHLDKIKLGTMVVAQPNNQNEYIAIPVWDFLGYQVDIYSEDYVGGPGEILVDENNERKVETPDYSYLTINAIDGTIIDRNKGY